MRGAPQTPSLADSRPRGEGGIPDRNSGAREGWRERNGGRGDPEGWGGWGPYSLGSFSTCRATEPAS